MSIEKQLSSHFSDEKIFEDAAIHYKDTLNKAGYINKLAYHTPSTSNHENKNKPIVFTPTRYPFPKKPHL